MVRQRRIATRVSQSQFDEHCLEDTAWRTLGLLGAFLTLVGGHHSLGATFLGS